MTDDERRLLEDTARGLIRLMDDHGDAMAGVEAALLEVYRAHFTTDDRKHETMARLRLGLRVLESQGRGARFMTEFIRKLEPWAP
jgi:hypothetical protein